MAKTSMKVKQQRKAKFSTREYTRCRICGRPHAYPVSYTHLDVYKRQTGSSSGPYEADRV